jgi:hypothetical protein
VAAGGAGAALTVSQRFIMMLKQLMGLTIAAIVRRKDMIFFGANVIAALAAIVLLTINIAVIEFTATDGKMSAIHMIRR